MALEPRFYDLDESVSALDVSVQAQILNLINDFKKKTEPHGLIHLLHDLSVVRFISDHILVMKDGRIIESDLRRPDGTSHQPIYQRTHPGHTGQIAVYLIALFVYIVYACLYELVWHDLLIKLPARWIKKPAATS